MCESRTAELRDIVSSLCGSETAERQATEYFLCGSGTAVLKVKALVRKSYCMEAKLRNFQATVFSLCGSGIAPFQTSKSHTVLYAEAELRNFKPQYISCAEAELQAKEYSLCGSGTAELQVTSWCVRGNGTSSHIISCMWNRSGFLRKNPKCPGTQGRRPLCQSHLGGAVLNCAILAVAPTGIVLVCSVLIKHD